MIEKKRGLNRSVCLYIQTEKYYVRTNVKRVYLQEDMIRTPSLANPLIQTTPPGTRLHGPVKDPYIWKQGLSCKYFVVNINKSH